MKKTRYILITIIAGPLFILFLGMVCIGIGFCNFGNYLYNKICNPILGYRDGKKYEDDSINIL